MYLFYHFFIRSATYSCRNWNIYALLYGVEKTTLIKIVTFFYLDYLLIIFYTFDQKNLENVHSHYVIKPNVIMDNRLHIVVVTHLS